MNTPKYFRIAVASEKGQILNVGMKVFENHSFSFYNGLTNENIFINIIYSYLAKHNLIIAEQELANRGFALVDTSNIPKEIIEKIPYLICDDHYEKKEIALEEDSGIKFLNKHLPLMTESLLLYLKRK